MALLPVCTRSIGDWDASRTLIPHPEIIERVVKRGNHKRFVIASDGLCGNTRSIKLPSLPIEIAMIRKMCYINTEACEAGVCPTKWRPRTSV